MIIIDYSFPNTGGGGISGLKDAVHSIPIFFKKFFFRSCQFSVDMRMFSMLFWWFVIYFGV